ncbi:MAG: hypothetical protein JOZ69_09965 [Myxococcales bacterium]|nr:hypothetical protein [Myxococcales bacterium]
MLDRFEAVCREHPQFLVRALSDVPATLLAKAGVAGTQAWRIGVLRKEAGNDGALTCYTDERPLDARTVMDRLKAFERTGDLAEFGHFHDVYVRRTGRSSHVRAVWTDGEFNLKKMFPAQGDAAGSDSAIVPRPPNASRTLAASSAEVPYAVHVYRSDDTEDDLRRFYDREMGARGWVRAVDDRQGTVSYLKGLAITMVTFTPGEGGKHLVSLTETAGSETPLAVGAGVDR